jgi:ESCRT-I complex subunit TSG101
LGAEDLAIEDTMEILAKALDHERLSLDIFLKVNWFLLFGRIDFKEMRKLAREQFLIKALIRKILTSAGIEAAGEMNGAPVIVADPGYYAPVRGESSYYS